jgi:hypothetical protein
LGAHLLERRPEGRNTQQRKAQAREMPPPGTRAAGGAVLWRREGEHPHSLSGCGDPEIQALPPPRVPLVFKGCAWRISKSICCGPQVHPGDGRCALFQISGCQVHLGISRCTCESPGAPGISRCAWHLQVHLVRTLLVKPLVKLPAVGAVAARANILQYGLTHLQRRTSR